MKNLIGVIKHNWRRIVSTVFVLLIFTMPSSRGIFAKIFNLPAEASVKHNPKSKKHSAKGGVSYSHASLKGDVSTNHSSSKNLSSVSHPSSQSTASPCSDTNSSSRG